MRSTARQENPTLSNTEISAALGKMWKEVPNDVKLQYKQQAMTQQEEFKRLHPEYTYRKARRKRALNELLTKSATGFPQAAQPGFTQAAQAGFAADMPAQWSSQMYPFPMQPQAQMPGMGLPPQQMGQYQQNQPTMMGQPFQNMNFGSMNPFGGK
jgi:transcription factor SOX7/8/10/18 (SOX group E/F)